MATTDNLTSKLKDIADAIREKTGTDELIALDQMDDLIRTLEVGGYPEYAGPYVVKPTFEEQYLPTKEVRTLHDINVKSIEVIETSNTSDGLTLTI